MTMIYTQNPNELSIYKASIENWQAVVGGGTAISVEKCNDIPCFSVEYSDILEDIHINIVNDASSYVPSIFSNILIGCMVAGIASLVVKKKKKTL